MADAMTYFEVHDGAAGPAFTLEPGQFIGVPAGETIPPWLRMITHRHTGNPPTHFKPLRDLIQAAEKPARPEAVPLPPLTEVEVRKRLRLQDDQYWTLAQQLGFPPPTMKRTQRDPHSDRITMIDLWQVPHLDLWVERLRQLAVLFVRG